MAEMCYAAWLIGNRENRVFREHRDAFDLTDAQFVANYRLTKAAARWLCDELRPALQRKRGTVHTLSIEQRVLCALRFFAAGGFQGTVASDEHLAVHQTTVSTAVKEVTAAIIATLSSEWLRFPQTEAERAAVKSEFLRIGKINGVIGCVDGTQVAIKAPSENHPRFKKANYWCRKQYYALNAMIVCDARLRILSLDATYPGSAHDSFVWRLSLLREAFLAGHLVQDGDFLLGDSGYPLEPWLLPPVPGMHPLSSSMGMFNCAHRSTRQIVERCIGMLKNRFRCLQRYRALHYDPDKATDIITACAILHNICLYCKVPEPQQETNDDTSSNSDEDDDDVGNIQAGGAQGQQLSLRDRGTAVRHRVIQELAARRH